jgi:nitrate/TMAO reductase-like tetraheme cytochrome c subunit
MALTLALLILLDLTLIAFILARPAHLATAAGRVLAFVALFLLPGVAVSRGLSLHLHESKTTSFCLSCHVMAPYGRSLRVDNADSLPASHFQNRRIHRDEACYTCHTSYAMFGDLRAKLGGLRHLYVNYLGTIPDEIELYRPYNNRECLHCHAGARSFEESELHLDEREALASNETSCLECHDVAHDLAAAQRTDTLWKEPGS